MAPEPVLSFSRSEVDLNTVVTASVGDGREISGNRSKRGYQQNVDWNFRGKKFVKVHSCFCQHVFALFLLSSASRASLSFWESDLWLYSVPPLRNLIDLSNPLLFDNPAAFRFTTCWVLHLVVFALFHLHRYSALLLLILKLFLVEQDMMDPESDSLTDLCVHSTFSNGC